MTKEFKFLGFTINAATIIAFLLYLAPIVERKFGIPANQWTNLVQVVVGDIFLIIGKFASAKFSINSSTLGAVVLATLAAGVNSAGVQLTGDPAFTSTVQSLVTEIVQALSGVWAVYGINNSYIKAKLSSGIK